MRGLSNNDNKTLYYPSTLPFSIVVNFDTFSVRATHLTNELYFPKDFYINDGSLTAKESIRYEEDCSYPHSVATILSCNKGNDQRFTELLMDTQNVFHVATSADAYISQAGLGVDQIK
jgi:hypothetical protein